MKSFIKNNKDILLFLGIFLLLCIWISLFPMVGDDWGWGNSYENIINSLKESVELWKNYNGRILGHMLVFFMSTYPIGKIIIMSLTFASLIFIISIFAKSNKKNIEWIIGVLLIIGMPFGIYREVFAWMSGFSNFGIPVLAMSIYICINRHIFEKKTFKDMKKKDNKIDMVITFILGFLMNLFSEHSAIFSVILGIGMLIITYILQKSITKSQISFLIGSIIGCTIMFLSPTYWHTMAREVGTAMENLNLIEKIVYNIKNSSWFLDICINNILSNAILCMLFILQIKKLNNNKKYIISTLILSILSFIICPIIVYGNKEIHYIFQIIIVIVHIACTIINLYYLYNKTNKFLKLFLLYLLSYIAALPLLGAVGFGPRCFINSYVLQCMFIANLYSYESHKRFKKGLLLLLILTLGIRVLATGINYMAVKERTNEINNLNDSKELIVERLPLWMYVHQSGIPASPYHEKMFKKYYNINKEVKLIINY